MKRLVIVHGMKRSGNHGIINWMLAQGRFLFFNNIIPIAPILRGHKPMPPPEDLPVWLRQQLLPEGGTWWAFLREQWALRRHTLLVSLEDHDLHIRPFRRLPKAHRHVLIVRDPYNLFASRIRKAATLDNPAYPREAGAALERVVTRWKQHAREYLGLTNTLAPKEGVYFNAWFADPAYRRALSQRLGLDFSDEGFTAVSGTGGGSSFDGTAYDADNRRMNVLDRASQLTDDERRLWDALFADDELHALARRLDAAYRTLDPGHTYRPAER